MRILAFSNLFPNVCEPLRARFNLLQFQELNSRPGDSVTVISPIEWSRRLRYIFKNRSFGPHGTQIWEGMRVSYPTVLSVPKVFRGVNGILMAMSVLFAWRRHWRDKPDIVFATWAYPDGFAAVLLGKLAGVPVFIKVHGTDVLQLLQAKLLRRAMTLWALRQADGIIAVSAYLRQRLIEAGVPAELITTIYNGIDTELFFEKDDSECRQRLALPQDAQIGIFVGNLVEIKGLYELIGALTPERCARLNLQFYIIGAGELQKELDSSISRNGVEKFVHLAGPVPHDKLPDWMGAANFICLPSHHEGLPNVLLEAMACRLPIVASKVGGIPEIVDSNSGLMVPPKDSVSLGKAIDQIISPSITRSFYAKALSVSSWPENAAKIRRLFATGA